MEGGQGPSLTAGPWKHGDDLASLERSIRGGYLDRGMPAFAGLGDSATKALAIYIRETATRAKDPQPREEHWGSPRCFVRDPVGHVVEVMAFPP